MPKLIEVSSFQFKPIHSFAPKTVNPEYISTGNGDYVDAPFINYGKLNSNTNEGGGYGRRFLIENNASQQSTNTLGGSTA